MIRLHCLRFVFIDIFDIFHVLVQERDTALRILRLIEIEFSLEPLERTKRNEDCKILNAVYTDVEYVNKIMFYYKLTNEE